MYTILEQDSSLARYSEMFVTSRHVLSSFYCIGPLLHLAIKEYNPFSHENKKQTCDSILSEYTYQ